MSKVQETKQVVDLAVLIAIEISKLAKDGLQFSDLIKLFEEVTGDDAKKAVFEAAIKDIKNVPEEVKAIDLAGGLELSLHLAQKVPEILEAFKKEDAVVVA